MFQMTSRLALAVALLSPCAPAFAADGAPAKAPKTAWEASQEHDDNATISTGVAKARDPLNSATSTSVMKEPDIRRLGTPNIAEVLRTVPGIRVETDLSETGNSYSIRGLPLVGDGAKYLQLQEDGLPVLEYQDLNTLDADFLLRNDLNLGSVESIRGGSSSTFATDAPGGVINFISKTGEVEGGSIMASTGLYLGTKRIDADYGGHINSDWRFHVGGFYRVGEGPRRVGYNAYRGGQIKFNVTRQFADGYIRLSFKLLDDRTPGTSSVVPVAVTGSDANPTYGDVPGFSAKDDSFYSRNLPPMQALNPNGGIDTYRQQDGMHAKSLAIGLEGQFTVGGWTISDRFRYSRNSDVGSSLVAVAALPASIFLPAFGLPGATATYFSGPRAGQTVSPSTMLAALATVDNNMPDIDFVANDLRANRVLPLGSGELTVTTGLYGAHQQLSYTRAITAVIGDVAGNGNGGLVDISYPGTPVTYNGTLLFNGFQQPRNVLDSDVGHTIVAPYGSVNFKAGSISLGGSVRYNIDTVRGTFRADNSATKTVFLGPAKANGDPSSEAEKTFGYIAPGLPDQVHYTARKLSWSIGANWRVAEDFSTFARYSVGSRAGADRILTPATVNFTTGDLNNPDGAADKVKQAEVGFKFRRPGLMLNLTGFYATSSESNNQLVSTGTVVNYQLVHQSYRAYGAEFEGVVRQGPFSLNAGATLTHAEITQTSGSATLIGNSARHQPKLIWQLTPEYDSGLFSLGASIVGATGSYSQDVNKLRLPAYVTVGLFARVRPVERVELGLNVSNLFDKLVILSTFDPSIPATGTTLATTLSGRRATASVRFFF
jgi:outer membrane receptor protein involved in Fe transport